jgi:hypothetical protein
VRRAGRISPRACECSTNQSHARGVALDESDSGILGWRWSQERSASSAGAGAALRPSLSSPPRQAKPLRGISRDARIFAPFPEFPT